MTNKKFVEALSAVPTFKGDKERQVEQAYNDMLKGCFPEISISNPFKCDGYFQLTTKNGKPGEVIVEYKYNEELATDIGRAKVLSQVLFYLKKIEKSEFPMPNVVMVADVNECFVLHVNPLLKYLDFEGVDWSKAPSSAGTNNPDLVLAISKDENLNTWVYDVKEGFDFAEVAKRVEDTIDNVQTLIHITEHNIDRTFKEFDDRVLKGRSKLTANDKVGVFMGCLVDADNFYLHPKKSNVLVANGDEIAVDGKYFSAFFNRYDQDVPPFEKRKLAEICDRLIEDETRRKKGEFYTPTAFVDYAHGRVEKVLGYDWKDEYVVWDCCCGTKNLTRDYIFKELYCSTLEQSELDISEKYNPQKNHSFQFDFLNDELKRQSQGGKVPDELMDALEGGKKVTFLINPPYGTGCNWNETSKSGTNQTMIREQMHGCDLGAGAENLQHQFLYRICQIVEKFSLKDTSIALFSNPIYLTGAKQKEFLKFYCDRFEFKDGVLFQASNFSDVSDAWGITFNIWTNGKTENIHNFKHTLIANDEDGIIQTLGEKDIYNVWHTGTMSGWVKEAVKGMKTQDAPQFSSGISVKEKGRGNWVSGGLGYYTSVANNVCSNASNVFILSSCASIAHGSTILPANFTRVCSAFTARKLIGNTWINHFDEYLTPDTMNPKYRQFEMDSVVYSLFNSKSQQSSLRNVTYKGKTWDIPNEFFFLSHKEVASLANDANLDETYNQAMLAKKEAFVYDFLTKHEYELSPTAKSVLWSASELVRKSFKYRELFNMEHPEYQVLNWDIGWYQVKAILKEYAKADLDKFRELYKKFGDELHPLVYELGFLKK